MINPKTLLGEWVSALQALPNLVAAIGDAGRIQFYTENATVVGQQTENKYPAGNPLDAARFDPDRVAGYAARQARQRSRVRS